MSWRVGLPTVAGWRHWPPTTRVTAPGLQKRFGTCTKTETTGINLPRTLYESLGSLLHHKNLPTVSSSSSHFQLIYKTRAHDGFCTKLFSREAADNKWSIFILKLFPSKVSETRHTWTSHLSTINSQISSARSFVITQVLSAHPLTVCWHKEERLCLRSEYSHVVYCSFYFVVLTQNMGRREICSPAQSVVQQWSRPYKYSSPHP